MNSDRRRGKWHNRVLTTHIFPAFVCSLQPACLNRHCVRVDHVLVRLLAEDVGCLGTACLLWDHTQGV